MINSGGFGSLIPSSGWHSKDHELLGEDTRTALLSSQGLHIGAETLMFSSGIYGFAATSPPTVLYIMITFHIMLMAIIGILIEMNFGWAILESFRNWLDIWLRSLLTPIGRGAFLVSHSSMALFMIGGNLPMGISGILGLIVVVIDIVLHVKFEKELANMGINLTVTEGFPGVYSGPGYKPMTPPNDTLKSYTTEQPAEAQFGRDDKEVYGRDDKEVYGRDDKDVYSLPTFGGGVKYRNDAYANRYHPDEDPEKLRAYQARFGDPSGNV